MVIINSKDLDAQMGRSIDPASIPKHDGASQGAMQAIIPNRTDHIEVSKGHGQRGTAIYNANEIPAKGFYGSSTVISVNDAPPLEEGLEPKPAPVPGMPEDMQKLVVAKPVTPKSATTALPVARQLSAAELLARMGMKPKS